MAKRNKEDDDKIHIELINDYRHVIFYVYEDGTLTMDYIEVVKRDPIVKDLTKKIENLYDSYYDFDFLPSHFHYDWQIEHMGEMLNLAKQLVDRLEEINDGSYYVIDYITSDLMGDYCNRYNMLEQNKPKDGMINVEVCNIYGGSLVYRDCDDNILNNPIAIINEDEEANALATQITDLYMSYFNPSINRKGFDYKREKQSMRETLNLTSKLIQRLNEINDGSYAVVDYISLRLQNEYPRAYKKLLKESPTEKETKKLHIILENDYTSYAPIWCHNDEGDLVRPPKFIQNDKELNDLAGEARDLYYSCFDFDFLPSRFHLDLEEEHMDEIIEIFRRLKERLEELNDGSYDVVDAETPKLLERHHKTLPD